MWGKISTSHPYCAVVVGKILFRLAPNVTIYDCSVGSPQGPVAQQLDLPSIKG